MKNEKGQIILLLILIMTVALAIGIAVIQRSISDISTSSKVEQSSRAFSAAEAGIEKVLLVPPAPGNTTTITLQNNSQAQATDTGLMPAVPAVGTRQNPLEYPPLAKEEVAQVWLADYTSRVNPPPAFYTQSTLDVYWGSPSATDKAALELTLIYYDGSQYRSRKWYLDQIVRSPANNFEPVTCSGSYSVPGYQCKKTITSLPAGLMLLRARLLYNNTSSQPFAVQAVGTCGRNCSIPPQQRAIVSTGTAGVTQRKVKLFQINNVVPQYFDYAIFSTGAINK